MITRAQLKLRHRWKALEFQRGTQAQGRKTEWRIPKLHSTLICIYVKTESGKYIERVSIAATHFPRKYELDRVQTVQSQPYQKRCNTRFEISSFLFCRDVGFHRNIACLLPGARSDAIWYQYRYHPDPRRSRAVGDSSKYSQTWYTLMPTVSHCSFTEQICSLKRDICCRCSDSNGTALTRRDEVQGQGDG